MIAEKKLKHEIPLPEGVKADLTEDRLLTIEGPNGKVSKLFNHPCVQVKVEGNLVKITPKKFTKNEKVLVNTFRAHIRNMIKGAQGQYVYKMKVCSSHFPMTVSLEGSTLIVKNLFGEKVPRKAKILKGAKVTIEGDIITIQSPDKEIAGQTAANIEQCTRITNRDRRVFADGIWITEKSGVKVK